MDTSSFDMVYGVVGLKAAGKGRFGHRLASAGFVTMTLSAPMRVIAERQFGQKYSVADLVKIGNRGRELNGAGYWAGETLLLASQGGQRKLVIDGIRNTGEIFRLRQLVDHRRLILVGIVAPTVTRFQRAVARRQAGDPKSLEDFLKMDDTDRGIGQLENGQQVDRCLAQVKQERIFNNSGSMDEFHSWIDTLHTRESMRVESDTLSDGFGDTMD